MPPHLRKKIERLSLGTISNGKPESVTQVRVRAEQQEVKHVSSRGV